MHDSEELLNGCAYVDVVEVKNTIYLRVNLALETVLNSAMKIIQTNARTMTTEFQKVMMRV